MLKHTTRLQLIIVLCLVSVDGLAQHVRSIEPGSTYLFKNGKWFDGDSFVENDFYVENGFLTDRITSRLDSTIDLNGKFVVPPYGEAHNHNISDEGPTPFDTMYVERGIFYVKNPNNMPRWRPPRGRVGMLYAVDATFANGGITSTDGHPTGLVQRNIGYEIFRKDDGDGGFLWYIDDIDDLNRKWHLILSSNPDFIKTYLLYSEEHDIRKNDTTFFNRKGLDPELLDVIVHKAHGRGLRVSTHVETAADFHFAVLAGSDEINHMPGFRFIEDAPLQDFEISIEDAKMAAEKGITVVTTLGGNSDNAQIRELHIRNLKLLKKYGVSLAIGSDQYEGNSLDEVRYLASLGVFTNLELLKMWCETTPKAIFPHRKIGKLKKSYEANFLVLNESPLENFGNTQTIFMRVKQGRIISYTANHNMLK